MKLKKILKTTIDIILICLFIILSIKKGGFYKTDSMLICLVIVFIGFLYIFSYYLKNILQKYIKHKDCNYTIDVIELLLIFLSFAYVLPILFNSYSNLSDSIFEMIRYFCMYIIYFIVKRSNNKKIYMYGIVVISVIQCIIGIDGLANRYLESTLKFFNSGYLTSNNLTRMSATIQYANVFSLLCVISNIYLINAIKDKEIEKISKSKYKYSLIFLCITLLISSIILSQSRVILIVLLVYLVFILTRSINIKNKIMIFNTILFSLIYSNIFTNILNINIKHVYIFSVIWYIIIYFVFVAIFIFFEKGVIKDNNIFYIKLNKNRLIISIFIIAIISIYCILALVLKTPIKLSSNSNKNDVSRNVYKLESEVENNILVKINPNDSDTRYKVNFLVVNDKLETTLIESFNYYSNTSNTFEINYIPKADFKYLIVNISCKKGNLKVTDILINKNKNYIDYTLVPSEIMYRINDFLNGDTSFSQRIYYINDSIKIITKSYINFFVGVGGEGFKNLYESVKTNNYSSTEVHNVYLQIFVESGIVGFSVFIFILLVCIKSSKNNVIKFLLFIIIVTSLFDLNFSYFLVMCIFSVLIALLYKKNIRVSVFKVIYNCYYIIIVSFCVITFVILLKANIAYNMKVPKITEQNSLSQIASCINIKEKRVMLDVSENIYRIELLEDYKIYLNAISKNIAEEKIQLKKEYENILFNIEENILNIKSNEKFSNSVAICVENNFRDYLKELVELKFPINKEEGYDIYLKVIISNIEQIENVNYDNMEKINIEYKLLYNYLKNINKELNSNIIQKYILLLDKKIM